MVNSFWIRKLILVINSKNIINAIKLGFSKETLQKITFHIINFKWKNKSIDAIYSICYAIHQYKFQLIIN